MEDKKSPIPFLLLVGAALWYFGAFNGCSLFSVKPSITINVVEPSGDIKSKFSAELATITREVGSYKNLGVPASLWGDHFRDFAKYLIANEKIIKTNADVRNANMATGQALFDQYFHTAGTNKQFSNAVDAAMEKIITKDNVKLTDEKRKELVEVLNAMAWAAYKG